MESSQVISQHLEQLFNYNLSILTKLKEFYGQIRNKQNVEKFIL